MLHAQNVQVIVLLIASFPVPSFLNPLNEWCLPALRSVVYRNLSAFVVMGVNGLTFEATLRQKEQKEYFMRESPSMTKRHGSPSPYITFNFCKHVSAALS